MPTVKSGRHEQPSKSKATTTIKIMATAGKKSPLEPHTGGLASCADALDMNLEDPLSKQMGFFKLSLLVPCTLNEP